MNRVAFRALGTAHPAGRLSRGAGAIRSSPRSR